MGSVVVILIWVTGVIQLVLIHIKAVGERAILKSHRLPFFRSGTAVGY